MTDDSAVLLQERNNITSQGEAIRFYTHCKSVGVGSKNSKCGGIKILHLVNVIKLDYGDLWNVSFASGKLQSWLCSKGVNRRFYTPCKSVGWVPQMSWYKDSKPCKCIIGVQGHHSFIRLVGPTNYVTIINGLIF
jgi:hypothetical protein